MATFSHLPSGKWRAQVRRAGLYRNATFAKKRDAEAWAAGIETQAHQIAASGFAPIPQGATLEMLIDKYVDTFAKTPGKTKTATLAMLKREIGKTKLASLSAIVLRDFIDGRVKAGAGGVTIAADLSFLSAVLKWGRHARQLDIPDRLALEARGSLQHRGLDTRSRERDREPTDDELKRLYEHWRTSGNASTWSPLASSRWPRACVWVNSAGFKLPMSTRKRAPSLSATARTRETKSVTTRRCRCCPMPGRSSRR